MLNQPDLFSETMECLMPSTIKGWDELDLFSEPAPKPVACEPEQPATAGVDLAAIRADIPRKVALAAHTGTSFDPQTRADTAIEDYCNTLAADYQTLQEMINDPAALAAEFARYRTGYKRRYLALLLSKARVVSPMIAGPSNFPVRRMQKGNRSVDSRLEELMVFRERAIAAIRKRYVPSYAIASGDADAVERLEARLEEARAKRELYKRINATLRQTKALDLPGRIKALVALGVPKGLATQCCTPDYMGKTGIPSYAMNNLGAEIRRLEDRLVAVNKAKNAKPSTLERDGITFQDDPPANRVRLMFPGKPDASTIASLKQAGFRWAPSLKAWQAYRNPKSLAFAQRFVDR
jgi:hypothetical protein